MMEGRPIPTDPNIFNQMKIIVMVERRPNTDLFEQMMLSPAQFLFVTSALVSALPLCKKCGARETISNPRISVKFENIRETYTEKRISEAKDTDHPEHLT